MKITDELSELQSVLQTALELETRGRAFFLQAAETTRGSMARKTFEFLAAEEDKHIDRINEFYSSLEHQDENLLPDTAPSDADRRLEEFNDRLARLEKRIKPSTTDAEAYRTALAFENGAERFYRKKAERTESPRVRKFYRWLMDEEEMHSRLLASCLEFAADPESWFKKRSE